MAKLRRPALRSRPAPVALAGADQGEAAALAARLREQLGSPAEALATLADAPPPLAAAALEVLCAGAGPAARELFALAAERAAPPVADAALAELAALTDVEAARALAEPAETLPDKERRKEARRALFHLRSQGIQPPAPAATSAPPVAAAQPRAIPYRALATHVDGVGSRLLWLFADRPLGGAYWFVAVLNDVAGLKDFVVRDSTRRRLAAEEAQARDREGFTWVELPVAYGQWLLQEAVRLNAESGFPLPTEYHAWREVLGAPVAAIERSLAYERVSRFEVKMRPELLRDSPHLFEEPEMEGWFLGYRDVQPYAAELRRARESRLVLSTESEEQRLDRILNQATRDLFTAPLRRALQRRLEETAYIFLETGRVEEAKRAIAAAVEIADADPLLLARHPFVRALLQRSIELAIQAERAGVDPAQYDRSPYDPMR